MRGANFKDTRSRFMKIRGMNCEDALRGAWECADGLLIMHGIDFQHESIFLCKLFLLKIIICFLFFERTFTPVQISSGWISSFHQIHIKWDNEFKGHFHRWFDFSDFYSSSRFWKPILKGMIFIPNNQNTLNRKSFFLKNRYPIFD
jgi:hypothetical protein